MRTSRSEASTENASSVVDRSFTNNQVITFCFQVYTVRPSRRPQQAQTKLTKRGRIRRPTRPPTTTDVSTLTVTSGYGQNEVPDVFTTESIPGAGQFHASLQPEYDLPQQYQYQSIQRHRQSEDQYLPDIRQPTPPQSEALGHLRVPDQMSLSSDNQPQYEADDLERGEESQWSTRTAALKAANAIQNADKSSTTQLEAVTADTPVTTTDDAEAALLMLTPSPDVRTSADPSTVMHAAFRLSYKWLVVCLSTHFYTPRPFLASPLSCDDALRHVSPKPITRELLG